MSAEKRDPNPHIPPPASGWPTYLREWAGDCDVEQNPEAGKVLRAVATEMERLAAAAGPQWTTANEGSAPVPVPPTIIA